MSRVAVLSLFLSLFVTIDQLVAEDQAQEIFFVEEATQEFVRVNRDGTGKRTISTFTGTTAMLAIDPFNRLLYTMIVVGSGFSARGSIYRSEFDGSDATTLITDIVDPGGFSLDLFNQRIFWTSNSLPHKVEVSDFNGGNIQTVASNFSTLDYFGDVHFDPTDDRVYWAHLDQIASEVLINRVDILDIASNTEVVVRLTSRTAIIPFDIDRFNAKLYWSDISTGDLTRADTDGANTEVLLSGSGNECKDLVVEPEGGPTVLCVNPVTHTIFQFDVSSDTVASTIVDSTNGVDAPVSLVLLPPVPFDPTAPLTDAPEITVDSETGEVTINLLSFSSSNSSSAAGFKPFALAGPKTVLYDLQIKAAVGSSALSKNYKNRKLTVNSKITASSTNTSSNSSSVKASGVNLSTITLAAGTYVANYLVREAETRPTGKKKSLQSDINDKISDLKRKGNLTIKERNKLRDFSAQKQLAAFKTTGKTSRSPDSDEFTIQ